MVADVLCHRPRRRNLFRMAAFNPFAELAKQDNPKNSYPLSGEAFKDAMWDHAVSIKGENWNKTFPYQLLILNDQLVAEHTFTLPIPPESLTITMPFAINTQVTLGGVVEEHNGSPIRMLSFSGTLGVLPSRSSSAAGNNGLSAKDALGASLGFAAGTIISASSVVQARVTAAQNILGSSNIFANISSNEDLANAGTGYYQFRLLQQFLEAYANVKKRPEGRGYRLAVAIWKDEAIYLVSPMSFEVRRSAASPLEYMYSMQFKAWRRITRLGKEVTREGVSSAPRMALQNALALLSQARQTCEDLKSVAAAIRGDLQEILEVFRQSILFAKDYVSVNLTLADLPADLALDAVKGAIEIAERASSLGSDVGAMANTTKNKYSIKEFKKAAGVSTMSDADIAKAAKGLKPGQSEYSLQSTEEIEDQSEHNTYSSLSLSDLSLPPAIDDKIQQSIEETRKMTRTDFEKALTKVQDFLDHYSRSVGASNDASGSIKRAPTEDDFTLMFALNQAALGLSKMIVASSMDTTKEDAIAYVAGLATRSGIAFQQPTAKIAVPFPYGSTLEQIAARYLGDAKRWHEIAALNGLRSPYVDEDGFSLPLLSNGKGNQVVVAPSQNLFVGQPVTLSASNTPRSARRITKIDTVNDQMSIVHLSGAEDLGKYTVMGQAVLHTYLPNTVNSQMQLYVPSTDAPRQDNLTSKTIPGVNEFDPMIEAGGVDLLLTPSGDLAITADGDCKLAVGLPNLVQRVRIALGTPKGTLPQHPDYGLGLIPGTSTADLNASQLLEATRGLFQNDPAFTGVYSATVVKKGPALSLSVNVGIAGQDIVLPVSVDVKS